MNPDSYPLLSPDLTPLANRLDSLAHLKKDNTWEPTESAHLRFPNAAHRMRPNVLIFAPESRLVLSPHLGQPAPLNRVEGPLQLSQKTVLHSLH